MTDWVYEKEASKVAFDFKLRIPQCLEPLLAGATVTAHEKRLSMEQLPLGLIPGSPYVSERVGYSPRDLFLILTDGITEVANARDEDFGLSRLQQLLSQHAAQPLSQLWDLLMREVKQHGVQQDDQSLLLLRVLE